VVLTSAIPRVVEGPGPNGEPPRYGYPEGGMPEAVDWEAAKAQFDAARRVRSVRHVLLVGSMGSARNPPPKTGSGNILVWKRNAMSYLIEVSGLEYTVINPGGLLGDGSEPDAEPLEILVSNADKLKAEFELKQTVIPRRIVADIVVNALLCDNARSRVMDVIAVPAKDGAGAVDRDAYEALFASAGRTL